MARYRNRRKSHRRRRTNDPINQVWRMLPAPLKRALVASSSGAVFLEALSSLGQ